MTISGAAAGGFNGNHVLAELAEVDPARLDQPDELRRTLRSVLTRSGATVHEVLAHRFDPQGVTVLAMLAESHASIHTYPELGTAFVDVFTCGHAADPELAVDLLATALGASAMARHTVRRGAHDPSDSAGTE